VRAPSIEAEGPSPVGQEQQERSGERDVLEEMGQLILIGKTVVEDRGSEHAIPAEKECHNSGLEPEDDQE
jgi:hypothetical protein